MRTTHPHLLQATNTCRYLNSYFLLCWITPPHCLQGAQCQPLGGMEIRFEQWHAANHALDNRFVTNNGFAIDTKQSHHANQTMNLRRPANGRRHASTIDANIVQTTCSLHRGV